MEGKEDGFYMDKTLHIERTAMLQRVLCGDQGS